MISPSGNGVAAAVSFNVGLAVGFCVGANVSPNSVGFRVGSGVGGVGATVGAVSAGVIVGAAVGATIGFPSASAEYLQRKSQAFVSDAPGLRHQRGKHGRDRRRKQSRSSSVGATYSANDV